jgi:hypothetical protein
MDGLPAMDSLHTKETQIAERVGALGCLPNGNSFFKHWHFFSISGTIEQEFGFCGTGNGFTVRRVNE